MSQGNLAAEWRFFDGDTGYARYTPSTAKRLTEAPVVGVAMPAYATHAFIFVHNAAVRIKVDASAVATGSEGGILPAGTIWPIENQNEFLRKLSFIDDAGASEVVVIYGRMP